MSAARLRQAEQRAAAAAVLARRLQWDRWITGLSRGTAPVKDVHRLWAAEVDGARDAIIALAVKTWVEGKPCELTPATVGWTDLAALPPDTAVPDVVSAFVARQRELFDGLAPQAREELCAMVGQPVEEFWHVRMVIGIYLAAVGDQDDAHELRDEIFERIGDRWGITESARTRAADVDQTNNRHYATFVDALDHTMKVLGFNSDPVSSGQVREEDSFHI